MPGRIPASTYRLQLGEGLGFEEARGLLGYLDDLGIDALYLSPIFASAGGGGYHVTDPTTIDPILGGSDGFDRLAEEARGRGMGIILDIVPNHMAAREESRWWSDVLDRGRSSPHARFFDIDWEAHGGKVLLPVLTETGAREERDHVIRVHWRDGLTQLNYRRFFDISDLVCLRQEDPQVFRATHDLTLRLVREGSVTGLRVDHVDGLRDPRGYLERLRKAAGLVHVVVEKILSRDEDLRPEWPVDGTTGYEFGDTLTGVLTDPSGAASCDEVFARFTGDRRTFGDVAAWAKRRVLRELFPGEVRRLAEGLSRLPDAPDAALEAFEEAIVEASTALPEYRTYIRGPDVSEADRGCVQEALRTALPGKAGDFLEEVLRSPSTDERVAWIQGWQQLTGPAMAKGFEDTALYVHTALVSRNEVGGDPGQPPVDPAGLHARMAERLGRWPGSLNATSTHDSKRSEDVRARIAVLSEIPQEWEARLGAWARLLPRREASGGPVPDPRETVLLFQTLLGAWPLQGGPGDEFADRIGEAMVKSAREAKLHSSWLDPDEPREEALRGVVGDLLADDRFLRAFVPFQERVALHGAVNGLAQVVLKAGAPGVPDLYQGTELWHLRLVDPDNRAPVSFALRRSLLAALDARTAALPALAEELREGWRDGRIKLLVTAAALRLRRAHRELFREGEYLPLRAMGARARHVVAFARRRGGEWAIVVAPRLTVRLGDGWPVGGVWGDTAVEIPDAPPTPWRNVLTGEDTSAVPGRGMLLRELLRRLPVALLAPR